MYYAYFEVVKLLTAPQVSLYMVWGVGGLDGRHMRVILCGNLKCISRATHCSLTELGSSPGVCKCVCMCALSMNQLLYLLIQFASGTLM